MKLIRVFPSSCYLLASDKRMLAGMTSGATAALVCNPIELVKTRQQGSTGGAGAFKYKGPIDGFRQLHKAEGVKGACGVWGSVLVGWWVGGG